MFELMLTPSDLKEFSKKTLLILTFPVYAIPLVVYSPVILANVILYLLLKPLERKNLAKWILNISVVVTACYYTLHLLDYKVHELYISILQYIYYFIWQNMVTA